MAGYFWAVLSSVFFSLYIVPRKLSKTHPVVFSFLMSFSFFLVSSVVYIVAGMYGTAEKIHPILLLSPLAGIIWAFSFVYFIRSIDMLGLSRSNQWKNLQGPVGTLLSLVILKEYERVNPIYALLSAVCIYVSALYFINTSSTEKHITKQGVYLALISGVGFGMVAVIQKAVTSQSGVYLQQVIWSLSISLSLLYYLRRQSLIQTVIPTDKIQLVYGLSAGVLYALASYSQLLSFSVLSASIAFTIIQINALWTILIGIFVFREIHMGKYRKNVIIGIVFTIMGIVLLSFARK